jgi:hypothetical protein
MDYIIFNVTAVTYAELISSDTLLIFLSHTIASCSGFILSSVLYIWPWSKTSCVGQGCNKHRSLSIYWSYCLFECDMWSALCYMCCETLIIFRIVRDLFPSIFTVSGQYSEQFSSLWHAKLCSLWLSSRLHAYEEFFLVLWQKCWSFYSLPSIYLEIHKNLAVIRYYLFSEFGMTFSLTSEVRE